MNRGGEEEEGGKARVKKRVETVEKRGGGGGGSKKEGKKRRGERDEWNEEGWRRLKEGGVRWSEKETGRPERRGRERRRNELTQDSPASIFTVRARLVSPWQFLFGIPRPASFTLRFHDSFLSTTWPSRRRFFPRRATCSRNDFCRPRLVTRASSKLHEIPRNEQLSQREASSGDLANFSLREHRGDRPRPRYRPELISRLIFFQDWLVVYIIGSLLVYALFTRISIFRF